MHLAKRDNEKNRKGRVQVEGNKTMIAQSHPLRWTLEVTPICRDSRGLGCPSPNQETSPLTVVTSHKGVPRLQTMASCEDPALNPSWHSLLKYSTAAQVRYLTYVSSLDKGDGYSECSQESLVEWHHWEDEWREKNKRSEDQLFGNGAICMFRLDYWAKRSHWSTLGWILDPSHARRAKAVCQEWCVGIGGKTSRWSHSRNQVDLQNQEWREWNCGQKQS